MLVLKALLLGAVQGLTEFFPVSSSGHLVLLGNLIGFETDLLFTIMLHIGSLFSVVIYFRTEIVKCLWGLCKLLSGSGKKIKRSFLYGHMANDDDNTKLLNDNYSKIALMIVVSMIPTVIVAILLASLVEEIHENMLCTGMGLLVTSLMLLIASLTKNGKKGPKEAELSDSFVIGLFQGVAVLTGFSRLAMALCFGIYRGFSRKFVRLYAFLLFVPTALGAIIYEGLYSDQSFQAAGIGVGIAGMLSALIVGYIVINAAMKIFDRTSFRSFAIYCFCIGLISIFLYL